MQDAAFYLQVAVAHPAQVGYPLMAFGALL